MGFASYNTDGVMVKNIHWETFKLVRSASRLSDISCDLTSVLSDISKCHAVALMDIIEQLDEMMEQISDDIKIEYN